MEEIGFDVNNMVCTISRVRFQKEIFAICECETRAELPPNAILGFSNELSEIGTNRFVALGDGLCTRVGQKVALSGNWEKNPKRNGEVQLRTYLCADVVGKSKWEIIAYLGSKVLKGVGKRTAELIYDEFGQDSLKVIEEEPEKLLAISGIGKKRLRSIVDSYQKNRALHSLVMLLAPHKVPYATIVRIYRKMGASAAAVIRANPYTLCSVQGFGYLTADEIALHMGVSSRSQYRIAGALAYVLVEAQGGEGHLFLTKADLVRRALKTLNNSSGDTVTTEEVEEVIQEEIKDEKIKSIQLSSDGPETNIRIYTKGTYLAECEDAKGLCRLISSHADSGARDHQELVELVKKVQKDLGVELDALQEQAVLMCMENSISIITGGPGTGKTTTLNVLVQAESRLEAKENGDKPEILLAAPTGRAARRMEEQTGIEAMTLHSLLGLTPDSITDFSEPSDHVSGVFEGASMLVIDESSMIDAQLMAELMYRVPSYLRVVFVGDADQLPSVGAGNVLAQMLTLDEIPHIKLEKVFRQGEGSVIPINSQRIREGNPYLTYNKYFKFIACDTEIEGAKVIRDLVFRAVSRGMADSVQILAPMRQRGEVCTAKLNSLLQDIVNPAMPGKMQESIGGTIFRVGDRVMQTRNIGDVSNGDMGYIKQIFPIKDGDKDTFSMTVSFQNGTRDVEYDYADALDVAPAVAVTIHKSQGSEFPFVIIPIFSSMSFFLQRNLIYTAVTRAKKQVVIVGEEKALKSAVRKVNSTKRNTILAQLVRQNLAGDR